MREAQLKNYGSGLAPITEGWFIVNVRDAEWWSSETRGAACWFANEYSEPPIEFAQLGINVTVLEPGQSGVYHAETNQEGSSSWGASAGSSSRATSDTSDPGTSWPAVVIERKLPTFMPGVLVQVGNGLGLVATGWLEGRRLAESLKAAGFNVIEVRRWGWEAPHTVSEQVLGGHVDQVPPCVVAER